MTFKSVALASAAVMAMIFTAGPTLAHSPSKPELVGKISNLAAESNLSFRGKVSRIDYVQPAANGGATGVPLTFVTYKISKILGGKTSSSSITLRFVGGPDGRGGFVDAEGVPTFQVGDEDILFVAGNGEKGCPLVQCEFGRYRVLENRVYEAHGSPVLSIANGKIDARGTGPAAFEKFSYPAPSFEDVIKRPEALAMIKKAGLSMAEARAQYKAHAPKMIETRMTDPLILDEAGKPKAAEKAVAGLDVDNFLASVEPGLAAAAKRSSPGVESAKIAESAVVATVKAANPPPVALSAKNKVIFDKPITKD